jgi:hypothetical protein
VRVTIGIETLNNTFQVKEFEMSKRMKVLSALAGSFLLSAAFVLAQGTMQGNQSEVMNGNQNGTWNSNANNNDTWYQQMMKQREQLQSRVQATDHKLSEELDKLQAAKSDDQKVQIMQKMFANLIDERNYVHDQVLPMMMYGNGTMMYGNGMMYGGGAMQNRHTMHSGHMGMQGGQSGMMNGGGNSQNAMSNSSTSASRSNNNWYREMMQQRRDLQSRVQKTDQGLASDLQKLQAAKTDAQKIDIMETMLSRLIHERTYVHDQALSMLMMNRQTQSARP